jgi:predicted nucleic acid-binding protein
LPTFSDTSALYALLSPPDRHHDAAVRAHREIVERREPLWTVDAVIVELWRLCRARRGSAVADASVQELAVLGLRIEPSAREDYARAWQMGTQWADQQFSLVDRLCFAAIERSRSYRAWSYDSDFAVVRLGPGRTRALALML